MIDTKLIKTRRGELNTLLIGAIAYINDINKMKAFLEIYVIAIKAVGSRKFSVYLELLHKRCPWLPVNKPRAGI